MIKTGNELRLQEQQTACIWEGEYAYGKIHMGR